ncbi:MAG TPA: hypothetical protein VM388_04940 [Acidimicrobiales bacterium]|nr:hypothetical protein [Acidimicrobiales bacterium]
MSSRTVRWGVRVLLVSAFVLASATPSPAPHVAQLQVTPAQARAGEEVTVFGPRGYGRTNPVEIRAGSIDGPILGTFQPNEELYAMWGPGTVRIPENAPPGPFYLFATQTLAASENHIRGVPARGEVTIVGPGGAPVLGAAPEVPLEEQEHVGLLEDEPVGIGSVLLVALGVAGAGLFIAGLAVAFSSRRRPPGQPAVTK